MTGLKRSRASLAEEEISRARLACLILGLVTLLAYLPVQFYDYAYYDDTDYVTRNPAVQGGLSWAGIHWAFTSFHASNWHPVTWLSHMLDWELFGSNPGAQHLVNALLHAANAMLFLVFWYRSTRRLWPSALAAALFAWHPLRVESVAWIAERKDVLSTFFGLLSLWFYAAYARDANDPTSSPTGTRRNPLLSHKSTLQYLLALLSYALGLMAKPMLVTWPFVLLLLDYWPLGRLVPSPSLTQAPGSLRAHTGRLVLEKLPFLALAVPVGVLTVLAQRENAILSFENCPPGLRLANTLISYVRYLGKFVWPAHLAISYPFPRHYPVWEPVAAAAVLLVISVAAWRQRRQEPFWLMGWLWYLGTLVPVIGLVQVGTESMADRYTYIPVMGVAVALAFGAANLVQRLAVPRLYLTTACSIVLGALLALTEHQLKFWQNPTVLFQHTLAIHPNNHGAHQVFGSFLDDQGQKKQALEQFQAAVKIIDADLETPSERRYSIRAHQALAHDYQQQRMYPQALDEYRILLRIAPDSAEVQNDLANLLADLGRRDEAAEHYQEAIRLKPGSPLPHENLGAFFQESSEFDRSIREFAEAARLAPRESRPRRLLGMSYLRQGDRAAAVTQFREAAGLDTNDVQSMTWLARILAADEDASLRNSTEALRWAETANALSDGRIPFVLDALGMAYAATDQYEEARKSVEAALRLERAAGHDFAASNLQSRLNLYEVRKPYREALRPDALPKEPRWDAGEALPRTVSPASSTPAVTAKTNSP